jgi:hypothetical protein
MNKKPFFVGLLVLVGCAWLAGCTVEEEESSDGSSGWGPSEPIDDERTDEEAEAKEQSAEGFELKARSSPNCGIVACPDGTECAYDESGEASCMGPPGEDCSTIDCGA